MIIYIYEVDLR